MRKFETKIIALMMVVTMMIECSWAWPCGGMAGWSAMNTQPLKAALLLPRVAVVLLEPVVVELAGDNSIYRCRNPTVQVEFCFRVG